MAVLGQTPAGDLSIEWNTNASSVRVSGPIPAEIQNAPLTRLVELFPVTVEPANVLRAIGLPPVLGSYQRESNEMEFRAQFPFEPGVAYRATFVPGKVSSVLRMPKAELSRTTVVTEVYPTAETLPQNLLKFYLHFSAPMSRGRIYEHIHLLGEDGTPVELPFLEIDEELWNPEMTRLTLFLDPGRIKRGVRPLEEVGPALSAGRRYTLRVDADWLDARGAGLKGPFEKRFGVTTPDREPPDPARWRIQAPRAGTREPVTVRFEKPMDQALALRLIRVKSAAGRTFLAEHETEWRFTPETAWKTGRFELTFPATIEDLAGNNVGKPFEVDLEQGTQPAAPPPALSLFFTVE